MAHAQLVSLASLLAMLRAKAARPTGTKLSGVLWPIDRDP